MKPAVIHVSNSFRDFSQALRLKEEKFQSKKIVVENWLEVRPEWHALPSYHLPARPKK